MKRLTIFSHFDSNNLIEDYVVFYLSELSKLSDIIFVSDCNQISDIELQKIKPYIINSIIENHGEYDFGSYKKGYQFALSNNILNDYEELIFANDSCYAPIFPFGEMFKTMSAKTLDFWGVTSNFNTYFSKEFHIQSYFIVFTKRVFFSDVFKDFVLNIRKENDKKSLIEKYEVGLSKYLTDFGYKFDVYSNFSKKHYASHILYYKNLLKEKVPFVKKSIPLLKANFIPIGFIKTIKQFTNYNYKLIEFDIKQNKNKINYKFIIEMIIKAIARIYIIIKRKFICGEN